MTPTSAQPRKRSTRASVVGALCLAITMAVASLNHFGFHPLWQAELYSEDFRLRHAKPAPLDPRLVLLAVDQPDYQPLLTAEDIAAAPVLAKMTAWPWDRSVHAEILERLVDAGAKAVVFDFFFLSQSEGDEVFRAALEKHRDRVVVAAMVAQEDRQGTAPEQLFLPLPLFEDALAETEAANPEGRVGFAAFSADPDGKVRRAAFRRYVGGVETESLAARALRKSGWENRWEKDYPMRLRLAGEPGNNYPPLPVYKLFLPASWAGELRHGEVFRDKLVLIGPYGEWSGDFVPTPHLAPMPGPELHLASIGAALNGAFLRELSPAAYAAWILLGGWAAWLVTLRKWHPLAGLALCLALALAWFAVAFIAFDRTGWILPMVTPPLALLASAATCFAYDFLLVSGERRRIRQMFSTMVSPEVLAYLQEHPDRFRLTGERREATVFFSDLAGFTSISENLNPEDLAAILNAYLTPMSDIVMRHGGYIDKYEGDAIMADFGVPVWKDEGGPDSHAWRACWAALDQLEKLRELQPVFQREYGVEIDMRIGINTGTVSAGNMGSEQKFQYTVMGDTVNQAARLEPSNKLFGTRVLIGGATYELAEPHIEARLVAVLHVKGRRAPVKCYELLAKKGELSDPMREVCRFFAKGYGLHEDGSFAEAMTAFDQALTIAPTDGPSLYYRASCMTQLAKAL